MSYLVLARKYRPKTFTEMVGQEHVVQALTNALTTQRLHHAYLFTGTRGVGKTTVSRILAKSLNCQGQDGQGGITANPCGVCQACTDIDADRFVDYTELDAASNRGIEDVQSLLEQAAYKPVQGRFKVFMIDEVHMLTGPAFNSMLKTLEEPPEYMKFVLATTDPQKVPVTVLSRCLQFNLRPMAPETVLSHLGSVLQQEAIEADPQALRLIARAARGSMRDALSLTDQAIAFGGGQLKEESVKHMLGSADRTYVFQLIEALANGDGKSVVAISETLRLHGLNSASTLEDMSSVLQRMAVLQAVGHSSEADSTDPEAADVARLANLMPADETQLLYSLCIHGRQELGLAPDEYAALTMVLLRLLAFKPKTLSDTTRATPNALAPAEKKTFELAASVFKEPSSISAQTPLNPQPLQTEQRPQPEQAKPREEVTPSILANNSEGDFWNQLVREMVEAQAINALVRELALQSQLIARNDKQWSLQVDKDSLNTPSNRERLQAALGQFGYDVQLSVTTGPVLDSTAKRLTQENAERQARAEAIILQDPFVQSLMRDFDAKIVPGSIKPV
ncbi:MAG: DNA polymerase III subunit gamma/tau [Burkholderiales bacterium]|nr:DNA polymerase III subunit gamma/tau [Burkholderiales bacterium]